MTTKAPPPPKYRKRTELRGIRAVLRKSSAAHTQELYEQIQTQGVMENLTIEIEDRHEFRRYMLFVENQWAMNNDFTYTIFGGDNQIAGQVSLYNISFTHRRAEVGIWLGRAHWGKNLGRDALAKLVGYAFQELHINRLQAHIFLENVRSIALFEGLHFQREGVTRQYVKKGDTFRDVFAYSLLHGEYSPQN
jgi:RimJ/RimL family protein N-acetyltransferase